VELLPPVQSQENITQSGGLSLQNIYEKVIDSVVSITCALPGGQSTGTGVILSADGYIVTNAHVVEGAVAIQVTLTDGRELPATLVGSDAVSDLAVLYIVADNLVSAEFGDSGALRVGDAVAAIGDPLGVALRGTMTNGIISAINRDITTGGRTMTLIQTNAALNSGNSGGPLINCYGQVVGINTMKIGDYMSSAGVEGLGFAIPSATVSDVVNQLIRQGYVSGRPTLGITGETVTTFYQLYYNLPNGLYISQLEPGCDAEKQGLRPGDILLSIGDSRIVTQTDLDNVVYTLNVGDTVPVTVYRDGTHGTFYLTVEEDKK
jgi:serine protease Do